MTFMMNEDKDLQKKYGKKNPFTVPENYFGDFAEKLMQQLPEKETAAPQTISLWDRMSSAWEMSLKESTGKTL